MIDNETWASLFCEEIVSRNKGPKLTYEALREAMSARLWVYIISDSATLEMAFDRDGYLKQVFLNSRTGTSLQLSRINDFFKGIFIDIREQRLLPGQHYAKLLDEPATGQLEMDI